MLTIIIEIITGYIIDYVEKKTIVQIKYVPTVTVFFKIKPL